jgi:hypothetical protein
MSELSKLREDHAVLSKLFRQLRDMVESSQPPSQLVLFDLSASWCRLCLRTSSSKTGRCTRA